VIPTFDAVLAEYEKRGVVYMMNGVAISSWEDLLAAPMEITKAQMVPILGKYCETRKALPHANSLRYFAYDFGATYRIGRPTLAVTKLFVPDIRQAITTVTKALKLETRPKPKAKLSTRGIKALMTSIPRMTRRNNLRRMISDMVLSPCLLHSGARFSSFCGYGGSLQVDAGARWEQFQINILPSLDGGPQNRVVAFYSPDDGKTKLSAAMRYPLRTGPYLAVSASYMLLVCADHDSMLGNVTLEEILDPSYLGPTCKPRRLVLESAK
jgi:hypothetical protein